MVVTCIISHGYMSYTVLQVLLFTATMPEALQEAAAKWQRKPVNIHLAPGEMSISQTITQVHSHTVARPRFCPDLFQHMCELPNIWLVFMITCTRLRAVATSCRYLSLRTLLDLYSFSLAVHAMRHPVYHCYDTSQSLSSLDALAGVPAADCCQPHSSGLDMLKHSLCIIFSRSSSKHGQFVRTSPNMASYQQGSVQLQQNPASPGFCCSCWLTGGTCSAKTLISKPKNPDLQT